MPTKTSKHFYRTNFTPPGVFVGVGGGGFAMGPRIGEDAVGVVPGDLADGYENIISHRHGRNHRSKLTAKSVVTP